MNMYIKSGENYVCFIDVIKQILLYITKDVKKAFILNFNGEMYQYNVIKLWYNIARSLILTYMHDIEYKVSDSVTHRVSYVLICNILKSVWKFHFI